ncbi:unnamed protein product [Trifolium pratense]|uniref:Uncharacterized protein n=1 Tax=Trifolium pratense TaxID=57577 RepID=A0ACB0KWT1_TRIPR|nr:unnamed protein product [Trifolium pratense]
MNMAVAGEADAITIIADKSQITTVNATTDSDDDKVSSISQMDSDDDKVSGNNKYIHDDLSFYILSKLPIKSLKRFGCVRKSWSILFENPNFMTMFRKHFIISSNNDDDDDSGHTFLLIHHPEMDLYRAQLHLLPRDQTFKNTLKLNLPPPFHDDDVNINILCSTSVNGIFCLNQYYRGGDANKVRFVLWNPATNEFVVLPPSPDESEPRPPDLSSYHSFHGFGYDKVRDDIKVFQYVTLDYYDYNNCPPITFDPMFVIYSLRTNSWRIIDIDMPYWLCSSAYQGLEVYSDGMCHWVAKHHTGEKCLLSFDLSEEVFFITPMDENSDFSHSTRYHLVVLNGSIALISNHESADTIFQISILGELRVRESWIKLFIIGPIPSFDWRPIGVGKEGYIFFRKKDDELAWVDLSTQIVEEIGVKGEEMNCNIGTYKESLLPIEGLNN